MLEKVGIVLLSDVAAIDTRFQLSHMVESPRSGEPDTHGKALSIDQLPPDIFQEDTKSLLPMSVSTPAENLKALVQECGVAPHKISELLHELPPRNLAEKLVDLYFTARCVRLLQD